MVMSLLVVTLSLHVLVWEEDGEELLILTSVQEMIVQVSGGRLHNLVLASVEWPVIIYRQTCSSASFSTNGISYQRVCGRARGYQKGDTAAFYGSFDSRTIDEDYVSGLSITYSNNPRQHIWTFASGRGERYNSQFNCPCSVNVGHSPSFVGNNYYCESASWYYANYDTYYFNDTLWDRAGCIDNCCDDTTQPWFYRQLNQTTQDDIEARICAFGYYYERSTLIDQLELYIQ